MGDRYFNSFIYQDLTIPMDIYLERRNGVRVSLGKNSIILRIPKYLNNKEKTKFVTWAENWFIKQALKNPHFLTRFKIKTYVSGDIITTTRKKYTIKLIYDSRKTLRGVVLGDLHTIEMKVPHKSKNSSISSLLSRVIAKDQYSILNKRIEELNHRHFNQKISGFKLKYNTSNWGSCSSKGNINISTRLLFAPLDVQDYVIIHELAHLIEANHSANFWKIISDILPDYQKKERWLSENSHLCYF